MARWDEILTLPVQNPPTLEFSAADIVWSRVEGWREQMDRLALIPFSRVNDFVRGESNNKECPTRFHVEARRRRPPEMAYKPKVDGILEYILYWCSFGPDDHRKGGVVRPSRNYTAKRKTPAGRPNTKRGCVCHFIVKRLIAEPSVALIIYNQDKHVDKKGLPCHGPMDKKAVGTRAMFAPYISDELRLQIMSLLYVGVPVETIMQRHTEMVEKQGGPSNRDDLLTHRYVRRLERKIRRSMYELDADDSVSIGMWIENHRDHIFFYEDFSETDPFVLGIQTEWQLQQMIHFGNRSLLASDSRFGTNKLKYPIYSLLVFDSNNNAIPVAWIITPNFANGDIHRWIGALYDRVHSKDPTWQLGGFIVDDPSADVLTIREVFQCSILISFWRVHHAWRKNLMEKCSAPEMRAMMSRRLGEAVSSICRGSGDMHLFDAFLEDFVDCSDFLDYFMAIWFPRIGVWTAALKALPLASSEVSAAIECYHHLLKLRLLNEKNPSVYQRADWLIDKLGTKVHSYYWLDEYSGKDNFSRYWKDEWKSGLTSWRQALQIPDSDVVLDGKCAKVVSQKDREKMHTVLNPGSEFAICDCGWSMMGNLCKHVIKSTKIYRDRGLAASSTSLFEYNRTLMSILNCPPHDSVIRDHAVALAVCVQTQLNALFDQENSVTTSGPREEQTTNDQSVSATENFDNADKDLINGCQSVSDNRDEVSGNNSHSVAKKNSTAVESISNNGPDAVMQSVEVPSRLLPTEQLAIDDISASNCAEYETRNLLDRANTSMDACGDYDAIHVANTDQVGDGALQNSIAEKMMDIDPHLQVFPTASGSGVLNGLAKEENAFQVSGVLIDNKIMDKVSEAHSSDPMVIDSVGVCNGVCDGTEKNQLIVHEHQGSTVETSSLDQNDGALGSRIADTVENNGNKGTMIGRNLADGNGCADVDGDVDGVFGMSNLGSHNPDGKEVDANEVNISEMDLRPCFVFATNDSRENVCIDQFLDVAQAEEKISADIREKVVDDGGRPLEETTSNAQTSSDIGRFDPSADKHSSVMDIEVSTNPVEEVQVVKDSSGLDRKDGVEVAIDASSVSNGTSNDTEEESSNGHVVHNMTLTECSALGQ
ncbi:uncharacterized protein [Elaeis guineensis]|uniref:Uncharacterized protein LOC105044782 n=1 Tax=Elaeis guineensis var. tenera TaxID=51953 RepID=A0A6I9R637_ELAGV|nr:uncharacterized protein LOC105044782 [Elaeis guineensis]XP_019706418.1 uncharacterized protein LOC105044782 [Elaeis guineensis]